MTTTPETRTCGMSAHDMGARWPGPGIIYPCDELPLAVITYACVHEHIDTPSACAACAAEVQQAAGSLICVPCDDGPRSHECLCDVRITWDDGSPVTIVQKLEA